jgi:Ca2+-binding EF-hand superfamily protein
MKRVWRGRLPEGGEWESALRRADTNSDGSVTIEEFRKAVKARGVRLGSNATRFIRRLFKSVDRNNHGVVAISRLLEAIAGINDGDDVKSSPSDSFSSDEESLGEIFAASDSLTREGLFTKLRALIQPGVSLPRAASKIERYFRKHGTSNSKLVSEEQFR